MKKLSTKDTLFVIGDEVLVNVRADGKEIPLDARPTGEIQKITLVKNTPFYCVRMRAPWGFTSGWYYAGQFEKVRRCTGKKAEW